ncbi:hypothetical protein [Streptomyces sp. NPDC048644]|uniref:hypothetical protein n=1 Tax=Streptomyces sp. NPDC048644 TaxID=3365582 RepID=UPI00371D72CE
MRDYHDYDDENGGTVSPADMPGLSIADSDVVSAEMERREAAGESAVPEDLDD